MKSVLVLAAHLDDSIIAVGGTIRKFVNSGYEVNVICFGNGVEAYTAPGVRGRTRFGRIQTGACTRED